MKPLRHAKDAGRSPGRGDGFWGEGEAFAEGQRNMLKIERVSTVFKVANETANQYGVTSNSCARCFCKTPPA